MSPLKKSLFVLVLLWTSFSNVYSQTCDYIYVSTTGSNANPGTEASPVQTLAYAMTLVSGTRTNIRMQAGTYNETSIINLQSNVKIDGQYNVAAGVWTKSSAAVTTINFSGEETVSGVTHRVGIKANGISGWGLTDLTITTTNVTGVDPSGRGKSNYAVWLNNCSNYTISRCSITSGNASAGTNGVNGNPGAQGAVGSGGSTGGCGLGNSTGGSGGNGGAGGAGGTGGPGADGSAGSSGGFGGGGGSDNGATTANTSVSQTSGVWNGRQGQATACGSGGIGGSRSSDGSCNGAGVGGTGATCATGAAGTNGTTVPASFAISYFIPSFGTNGTGGTGGIGGSGGGGGAADDDLVDVAGDGGSGGSGGGGGGEAGTGGTGGGGSFSIFRTNSSTGATIISSTLISGAAGTGGIGGTGGAGGAFRAGTTGNCGCGDGNRGGAGGGGAAGGAGGNGGNGGNGLSGQLCTDGVISSPSTAIAVTPTITANYYGCTNSEVALTTASGVWAVQPTASFVNNLNSSTSSYTTSSASAIMTYSSTGYKDINNGTAFNNFVSIITTRALPTFDAAMSATACEGTTYTFNTPTTGIQYEWVVFLASSTTASPLTTLTTQSANWTIPSVGAVTNYSVRLRVKDACCGWSAPVYFNFTGSPLSTAPTIAAIPSSVCPNTNITLTASGGTTGTGSNIYWYTGPNGTGTLLGTGASIVVAPTTSTTYYARREGTCNTTSDASTVVNVKAYIYAANGTSTSNYCTDNAGWNHFYVGDDIILSVQGDLSGAGVVTATIYDNGIYYQNSTNPALCSSNVNPGEQSFEMERSWNLDLNGGTPIGTYNVRFYHTPAEKTAVETAAANWMATYPACSYTYKYATPLGFYWFKNTGSNYTAPDYDGLHLAGASGTTSNGVNFSELSGITSFSGGSGAVTLVPLDVLPVTLSSFNAICAEDKKSARIEWTTASEQNSSHFVVERSTDAVNWNAIATIEAAGNSINTLNYSIEDNDIRQYDLVYYRLKEFDLDAAMMQSGIVSLNCVETTAGFDVYPNPTNAQLNVLIYGIDKSKVVSFVITDLKGQQVKSIEASLETENLMQLDVNSLAPGCYIIQMKQQNAMIKSMRFIKE